MNSTEQLCATIIAYQSSEQKLRQQLADRDAGNCAPCLTALRRERVMLEEQLAERDEQLAATRASLGRAVEALDAHGVHCFVGPNNENRYICNICTARGLLPTSGIINHRPHCILADPTAAAAGERWRALNSVAEQAREVVDTQDETLCRAGLRMFVDAFTLGVLQERLDALDSLRKDGQS